MSAFDDQVGGNHYKLMMIQPTEYILANNLGFCEGNVVKYVSRWRLKVKDGEARPNVEDLRKAKHYIDMLIEREVGGYLKSEESEAPKIGGRVD